MTMNSTNITSVTFDLPSYDVLGPSNILQGTVDLLTYKNWFLPSLRPVLDDYDLPSVVDLWPAIVIAVAITALRLGIITPIGEIIARMALPINDSILSVSIPADMTSHIAAYVDATHARRKRAVQSGRLKAANVDNKAEWNELSQRCRCSEVVLSEYVQQHKRDRLWRLKQKKFSEAFFLFVVYTLQTVYGMWTLSDKPYGNVFTQDIEHILDVFPWIPIDTDVRVYYWTATALYLHLSVFQFSDIKRKDMLEMAVHHVITLLLLVSSWSAGFSRIGAVVLIIHDAADVFLQLAKLLNYMALPILPDIVFVIFAVAFAVTRLYVLPFRIMHTTFFVAISRFGTCSVIYCLNGMLMALVLLHLIWFSIICRMIVSFAIEGKVEKDARSDTEADDDIDQHGTLQKKSDHLA